MSFNLEDRLAGRAELLALLVQHGIAFREFFHSPVTTMQEFAQLDLSLDGVRCKNLLMQDKKGRRRFLLIAGADAIVDASSLGRQLGCGRLSMCSADVLRDCLGVEPGAVSPLALINDPENTIDLLMDANLDCNTTLMFHPLVNTSTVAIARSEWHRFLSVLGRTPQYVNALVAGG
jgi:Ala-tRNA(Pro) deacylase